MPKMYGDNGGDVIGPNSSTDNAIPRFNGTDGIEIQNSGVTLDNSDNVSIPGSMTITGDTDAVQLLVKANATQTNWLINGQSSAGADMFYVSGTGVTLHKTSVNEDSAFAIFSSTNERLLTVRTTTPAASAQSVHAVLNVTPGGGALVGSSKTVMATNNSTVISSGTQSAPAFGSTNVLEFTGSTALTSTGARALYNQVHWYSSATTAQLTGLENQFLYGSVSAPTGKVTTAYGLRGHVGQFPGSVGGSFGTFAHFSIRTPGADANNTIDNIYGFHMEDQVVTGVGASYGVFIEDQGAGGYAWKSGTGLNEFGDQVVVDTTQAEALQVRQVGDTGDVATFNTLVASTAATSVNTVDIATGAGAQAGSAYSIVGVNLAAKIDSGTHSAPLFGMNILTQTSATASKTGTFGNHQTGVNFISRHDSTGTNEEIYGVVGQTILGGPGSTTNIGAVTAAYGMRFSWEYQTTGTGSVTTAAGIYIPTPGGTSGTKTVTNNYGLLLGNQAATGITNAYAIKTGTGVHEFGDFVSIKGDATAAVSSLEVAGSQGRKVTTLNASTLTLDATHDLIAVAYTATGAVTITLPSATSSWNSTDGIGRMYEIADSGCNAATNNITINRAGSDTISDNTTGNTSVTLIGNGDVIKIVAINATTWKTL